MISEETKQGAVMQLLTKMLNHPDYPKRSFEVFHRRFAPIYEDATIRDMLVAAGAVRFVGAGEKEYWGLLARNGG